MSEDQTEPTLDQFPELFESRLKIGQFYVRQWDVNRYDGNWRQYAPKEGITPYINDPEYICQLVTARMPREGWLHYLRIRAYYGRTCAGTEGLEAAWQVFEGEPLIRAEPPAKQSPLHKQILCPLALFSICVMSLLGFVKIIEWILK